MHGVLNVHKPAGMTSRDVVNRIARLVKPAKAGHAGTLDPLATGVLVVGIGAATRLVEYVQQMPKRYRGTFLLGRESTTEDVEGTLTEFADERQPTREELESAARTFVGTILQRPPQFSALKVAGRRAYDLARRGEQVDLEPREIVIHRLELGRYAYPEFELEIECGSGTYVRSLGRDLAEALECHAVMSKLERTAIGHFQIDSAISLDRLDSRAAIERALLPTGEAVRNLPLTTLTAAEAERIGHGMTIERHNLALAGEVAAFDSRGRLVSILGRRDGGTWGPVRNLPL
jgi:tRNA pseudouridine55 synthase